MSTIKANKLQNVAGTTGYDIGASFSNRNKFINGGMRIWQRGTSFSITSSGDYTADRWLVRGSSLVGGSVDVNKSGFVLDGGYSPHLSIAHVSATSNGYFAQKVEGKALSGKTVTYSAEVYINSTTDIALRVIVKDGGATTSDVITTKTKVSIVGQWVPITFTTTLYSSLLTTETSTDTYQFYLQYYGDGVDAVGTNTIRFRNIQLEEGIVVTPFEQTPVGHELSLCKHYYQRVQLSSYSQLGILRGDNTGGGTGFILKQEVDQVLRIVPVTTLEGTLSLRVQRHDGVSADATNFAVGGQGTIGYKITGTASNVANNILSICQTQAIASAVIHLNAEL